MRIWPDILDGPDEPGYGVSPMEQSQRSDMEVGAPRSRRLTAARRDRITLRWRFDPEQYELFSAWYHDAAWSLVGDSDALGHWTRAGASVAADTIAGPNGALADRLVEDIANSTHRADISLGGTVITGTSVVLRATLRAAGRTWARIGMVDRAGSLRMTEIDLATGALGAQSGLISREVQDRGNGFWRVTIVVAAGTGATTPSMRVQLMTGTGVFTYTGDGGSGIDVCELQARVQTGFDLFAQTRAGGLVDGAAGGSAWFMIPLPMGGALKLVEAQFSAPFEAQALAGLNWDVTAKLLVRNA